MAETGIYTNAKLSIGNGAIDLDTHTFKVILLGTTHTFNAADTVLTDVSDNEITGTNYTAGGETLTRTWSASGTSIKWDAADVSWTGASFIAYHAVVYDTTGNVLVCSIDFGGAQTVSAGTFTIQWNADGILLVT